MNSFCGIDIGGTGVKLVLLGEDRSVLASDDFSTDSIRGLDAFLQALSASLTKMRSQVPGTEVLCLRRLPLGDPTVYRWRGIDVALRRRDASRIEVFQPKN